MNTTLTNLESQIMEALQNVAYGGMTFTDEVIAKSGIESKIARGVLSSLIQKNIIVISEEQIGLVIDKNDIIDGIDWEYRSETVKEFIANL